MITIEDKDIQSVYYTISRSIDLKIWSKISNNQHVIDISKKIFNNDRLSVWGEVIWNCLNDI